MDTKATQPHTGPTTNDRSTSGGAPPGADDDAKRRRGVSFSYPQLIAAVIAMLAIGLLVGLWIADDDGGSGDERAVAAPTALAAITAEPDDFMGKRVLIGAEIEEVLGPRTFVVGGAGFLPGGERILVVTDEPTTTPGGDRAGRPLLEGDLVVVSGRVERFDAEAAEEEIGAELGRDASFYEGEPAVAATAVTVTPRLRPVAGESTPRQIVDKPEPLYGKYVSVEGTVTDVLRDDAIVVNEELLVLVPLGERTPLRSERVDITGPVRRFDPDQRLPSGRPGDANVLAPYASRPALVAEDIVRMP